MLTLAAMTCLDRCMRALETIALLALGTAACDKERPAVSAPSSGSAVAGAGSAAGPGVATGTAPAAASLVRVDVTAPGTVVVRNDTDAPVRIAWDLPIEREGAGGWAAVHSLQMMTSCFDPAPADKCVAIAPRAAFTPRPWTGWFGCTQCGTCRANAPAQPGRYRVVAIECGSNARHEGPAMEIVSTGRFAHTPHLFAPKEQPDTIQIDNESDAPVSFQTAVAVLRLDASRNAYDQVTGAGMILSDVCRKDLPPCTTIPAHGTLRTLPYRPGCSSPCAKCGQQSIRPGTYLLRVTVCDTSKPLYNDVVGAFFETEPFVVDRDGNAKSASRAR